MGGREALNIVSPEILRVLSYISVHIAASTTVKAPTSTSANPIKRPPLFSLAKARHARVYRPEPERQRRHPQRTEEYLQSLA
jgi:hypothetical protein